MEKDKPSVNILFYSIRKSIDLIGFTNNYLKKGIPLSENFAKGYIPERLLIGLLIKSLLFPSVRQIIPDIFDLTHECSITNRVLFCCLHYPGKFRNTLLVQLAHMWLDRTQLEIVNRKINTPEAFCKLLIIYAEDNDVTLSQFSSFLISNRTKVCLIDCDLLINTHRVRISPEKNKLMHQLIATFW